MLFEIIDASSGVIEAGYIKNGKMKYKSGLPWYKRIFGLKRKVNIYKDPKIENSYPFRVGDEDFSS